MTMRNGLILSTLCALALGACSSGSTGVKSIPAPPNATAEVDASFDLLMQGNQAGAQQRLQAVLKREPMNANAQLLNESIARDPRDLLGPQSYAYTVRDGDTVVGLAERFLGNRLKAYQLLRYNGLKAPAILAAGQVLRIPGEQPRPEPVRRPEPASAPVKPSPPPRAAAAKPKPAPAGPAVPAVNPSAARQLRTAGLAALNQGAVPRAVTLLRRAAQLDPTNPVIAHDLARAERIAATVRTKK
jgi:LysM repeat protein